MATKRTNKKTSAVSVDFSNTESQQTVDEGDYLVEVEDVEKKESENSGEPYLALTLKIVEGDFKGSKLYHNCSLQPQALFNLRGVLEALGFDVPSGVMELDPADMIGEKCGVSVAHESYKGKTKARPVEFFPEDELEGRGEEPAAAPAKAKKAEKPADPEPAAAPTKKKKKATEPAFAVGDTVKFTDDEGNEQEGEITEIAGDDYTVTVETGKGKNKKTEEWTLEVGDLTKVED